MLLAVLTGALTCPSSSCPLCCKVHGVRDKNVTLLNNNITNADNDEDAALNYFSSLPAPRDTPNLQKYYIQKTLIILDQREWEKNDGFFKIQINPPHKEVQLHCFEIQLIMKTKFKNCH